MKHQILRFGVIGTLAAATHMSIVALLVTLSLHPLLSNIFGFTIAFGVSYFGHRFWTFDNKTQLSHRASVSRFWIVAVTSFAINESLYYLFLEYTTMPYLIALFVVLIIVTPITFLLSRFWAFR